MFEIHRSSELRDLFVGKPYQGAAPEQAKFVFIGLDANYANDIDQGSFFSRVLSITAMALRSGDGIACIIPFCTRTIRAIDAAEDARTTVASRASGSLPSMRTSCHS